MVETELISKRLLARNTLWNLMGQGIPFVLAFFTMPLLIKGLGTERFGILTLAWMVIGYFSFFDMGVGRATTKFVSEYIMMGEVESLPPLFWTAISILFGAGIIVGIGAIVLTPRLVTLVFNIPPGLREETQKAFYLLALSIPLVLSTSGTRGVLEGLHRFRLVNVIKIPANAAIIVTPLLVLPFSHNLYHIVGILVLSRFLAFLFYFYYCLQSLPNLKKLNRPSIILMKKLLSFGGWLALTNVVGSLIAMGYIDRFLISSILTMSSVSYYVTPFELITKLWIFPYSLMGVLFPVMSASTVAHKDNVPNLHYLAIKYILLLISPVVIAVIVLARPFLTFWVGTEFAQQSTLILQLLSVGVLLSALSQVPFTVIQSLGRPDLTAKRHLWELPFYVIVMWFLIRSMGIAGAALTWLLWTIIDTVLLFWLLKRLMPVAAGTRKFKKMSLIAIVGSLLFTAYVTSTFSDTKIKVAILLFMLIGMLTLAWTKLLDNSEKMYFKNLIVRTNQEAENLKS